MAIGVYCKNCIHHEECNEVRKKYGIITFAEGLVDCYGYRAKKKMDEKEVYMTLKVMLEDGAFPPSRSFPTDAGLDLCCREEFVLWPRHSHTFDTGVHIRIPPGYYGKVEGRSGLNRDFSVTPTGGVIDETYTGSIGVKLYNLGKEDKVFHPGDRIAQLIIQPCIQPEIEFVDALEETDRGGHGFGSTGA